MVPWRTHLNQRPGLPGRRAGWRAVAVLAGLALAASACASGKSGSGGGANNYTVGLITATQGNIAFAGGSYLKGAQLAIAEINDKGVLGQGKKLTLKTEEGSEKPDQAINAANRLISDRDTLGLICCVLSPVAGALKPVTQAQKMPLVIYGATLPGLASLPYTTRSALLPQPGISGLAKKVVEAQKPKNAAYVVTADNEGMQSQLKAFQEPFNAGGVDNLGVTKTLAADTDFSGPATEVISKKPEVVVVSCIGEPSGGMIKALRDRGYKGLIVGNATISTQPIWKSAGQALVGVPFPIEYAPASDLPAAKTFTKDYQAKYNNEAPDTYSSQGYTAVYYLAAGLKNAIDGGGKVDREALAKGLAKVTTLDTIWGKITFKDGQAEAAAFLNVVWNTDGKVELWKPKA